jgi:hypothetical protein
MSVCFIVLTCEKYIPTRVKWQTDTFLKEVNPEDIYFLSCSERKEGIYKIYGWNTPDNYEGCPLKYVSFLKNITINYDWYCFIDDDSFIHINNLKEYLKSYDHRDNLYIGHLCTHISPRFYMAGGAGFILSRSLYYELLAYIRHTDNEKLLISNYGDYCMGMWVKNIENVVIIEGNDYFYQTKYNENSNMKNFISYHFMNSIEDFTYCSEMSKK